MADEPGVSETLSRDSKFPWYLGLIGLFSGLSLAMIASRRGERLNSPSLFDMGLLALAAFGAGRILALDEVTRPFRAPFVREEWKDGERMETPLKDGLRGALGEMLTCSDCVTFWAATALLYGYLLSPVPTRTVAAPIALTAVANLLNTLYADLEAKSQTQGDQR